MHKQQADAGYTVPQRVDAAMATTRKQWLVKMKGGGARGRKQAEALRAGMLSTRLLHTIALAPTAVEHGILRW